MGGMLGTVVQAALLSILSNVLAQLIAAQRESKPLDLDVTPVVQFVIYTILNTPLNCLWQEWLEERFPGRKPLTKEEKEKGQREGKLDFWNTFMKFALDQTVGAAFNTTLFIAAIGALKGQNWEDISETITRDAWSIYVAGSKLWPAVSVISFVAIPVEKRVIFGSVVGVLWGIYLSTMASG